MSDGGRDRVNVAPASDRFPPVGNRCPRRLLLPSGALSEPMTSAPMGIHS